MRIIMCTNTYLPHVGGVAKSVATFVNEYRRQGHDVLVVAPEFDGCPVREENVIRLPAVQNFNSSDFSIRLPIALVLRKEIQNFNPDIIHSHHPFLLGADALRLAAMDDVPLVFTHHTLYERYTHYVPGDCELMQKYAVKLAVGYCNMCSGVIAPSESIEDLLRRRGVTKPIKSIPTGVDVEGMRRGDRSGFRKRHSIADDEFVVGHVGRLSPEKNLGFLADAVAQVAERVDGRFLVVGDGPSAKRIKECFEEHQLEDRLVLTGKLGGQDLIDAYHAMDIFAFASQTETQGMVLLEAMAAGIPVVAIDGPGVRDVVTDQNGILIPSEDKNAFANAVELLSNPEEVDKLKEHTLETAHNYSNTACANSALDFYRELIDENALVHPDSESTLDHLLWLLESEWKIWKNRTSAAIDAVKADRDQLATSIKGRGDL